MICFQVEETCDGSFVAEDVHLPHMYVDRVIKGEKYEKRIEVRLLFLLPSLLPSPPLPPSLLIACLPSISLSPLFSLCFSAALSGSVRWGRGGQDTSKGAQMRERIIRRAALEFTDGMYGILLVVETVVLV